MTTRKLYYEDSHLASFRGKVLSCTKTSSGWEILLDATAFYPEGGGQAADTGTLNHVKVLDTRERGETVVHICDGALDVGLEVEGNIDYPARFLRMQQHTGELIVSGLLYQRYGCHNVGFHMGSDIVTIDFDLVIPAEDLPEIEQMANGAVWANLPVKTWYPTLEELPTVAYRSKKELPWPVRIVRIPGFDTCACCGTHVKATGEIGIIKLFSAVHFRGGTRIEMACGSAALSLLNTAYIQNRQVGAAFSVQAQETGAAARRMNDLLAQQKYRITGLERRIFDTIAQSYAGKPQVLHFEAGLDGDGLRTLTDKLLCAGVGTAAVFTGTDDQGYAFCLASREADLRSACREMTTALHGRGGGKPGFQQGRVMASREEIVQYFEK